jgi:hypothetical protein
MADKQSLKNTDGFGGYRASTFAATQMLQYQSTDYAGLRRLVPVFCWPILFAALPLGVHVLGKNHVLQ